MYKRIMTGIGLLALMFGFSACTREIPEELKPPEFTNPSDLEQITEDEWGIPGTFFYSASPSPWL